MSSSSGFFGFVGTTGGLEDAGALSAGTFTGGGTLVTTGTGADDGTTSGALVEGTTMVTAAGVEVITAGVGAEAAAVGGVGLALRAAHDGEPYRNREE